MHRVHNFSAGPAALPLSVLEKARDELLDFAGTGASVMEISHRGKAFDAVIKGAEENFRRLMGIPDDYAVLFMPGGASQQFAMIPMNLRPEGFADYVHTGAWAEKAIKEARVTGDVRVVWDGASDAYMRMPRPEELTFTPGAAYVHICSNETIGGVRWTEYPATDAPLVADMSSDILSRPIDVRRFGMIYAGAQKNIGPSGLALVVLRRDLAERCPETAPIYFRYRTHMKEPSLYNTPNTWAIYLAKLVTDELLALGGLEAMAKANAEKAAMLYGELDASAFWTPCAQKPWRSDMNVTWRIADESLEPVFVKEATAAGLDGLKGHRSVGGLRASVYNAVPRASVEALVSFMRDFRQKRG